MTELELQAMVADYLRLQYPSAIFHSDYGSGIKLTMGQAIKQKRLNGGRRSWPDMLVAEPKGKYSGLFIELKKEGVRVYKKDGTLVSDGHIREQYDMLEQLRRRGYAANFACGFDEAKALIDRYMRCAD